MTILQRLIKYDWSKEALIVASIVAFVLSFYYGAGRNTKKVVSWIDAHRTVLKEEFYQVGFKNGTEYIVDSPTEFVTFASGRSLIPSVTTNFSLKSRQNLIGLSLEYIMGFFFGVPPPVDTIDVAISIDNKEASINGFVFAIVNKEVMKHAREDNYYLSLTKTTDSPKLPINFVFMSEFPEVTDSLFTPQLEEIIQKSAGILNYISFTDQGRNHPEKVEDIVSVPRLVLSLNFPKNAEEAQTSAALLQAAIGLVDIAASKQKLRPETLKKLKATRDAEIKKIVKLEDEKRAEELADKKAKEKREERNRISKLSPAEQRKIEEKERQKEQRKLRSKQMRRG